MEKFQANTNLISTFIELIKFLDRKEKIQFVMLNGELNLCEPSCSESEAFLNLITKHSERLNVPFHTLLDYYLQQLKAKNFEVTEELTNNGALIKIFR